MSHLRTAIPLVLPNNCTWDHVTGRYNKDPDDQRRTLVPQENTLDELRKVKGPVCVVAVAGPCRNGKSFILGETFGHSEVCLLFDILNYLNRLIIRQTVVDVESDLFVHVAIPIFIQNWHFKVRSFPFLSAL